MINRNACFAYFNKSWGIPEAGLELGQAAAKIRPGLPIVYTTGRGVTDGMIALFVQPYVFLAKPYTAQQLLTAVSNLLPQPTPLPSPE